MSPLYNLQTHSVGCARCREDNNFFSLAGIRTRPVRTILTTLVRILLRRNIIIYWAGEVGRGIRRGIAKGYWTAQGCGRCLDAPGKSSHLAEPKCLSGPVGLASLPWRWKLQVTWECQCLCTRLYAITAWNTVIT